MPKVSKAIKKKIAEIAKNLPAVPMAKFKVVSRTELIKEKKLKNESIKEIQPNKIYTVVDEKGSVSSVNHERRMQNIFLEQGLVGIESYVAFIIKHYKN